MNQKKRTQEKNKFSKLRLHSSSNKSRKSCSPHPQEKISSYFSSVLNESELNSNAENASEDVSDSIITRLRNKKCVQKVSTNISSKLNIDNDTSDDTNDFTKPKTIKITKKLENKPSNFENLLKNVGKRKSQFVSNPKVECLKNDTNQEHLQLAIAMSKSILDLENPQEAESAENTYPSTQQKIMRVKQTLDQFGFKTEKSSTQPNLKTNVKLAKGKKYKYFTPTLFLRTEADRTKLIDNKVSQILNNISIYNNAVQERNVVTTNNTENKPRSFILRDYYKEEPILFNKNALSVSDAQESKYYNSIVQPSNVEVGVLLNDWLTIPGREATPPLEENILPNEIAEKSVNILQVPSAEISMSPELFTDSDNDDITEHNEKNYYSSKRLLNSTDSITQIGKEKNMESCSSTKSVSLLDNIKTNNNINIPIIHMAASGTETIDLSLSPFPQNPKPKINETKQMKLQHDQVNLNNENTDSLSPFESVTVEIKKSPQRKVTPKKKSPSPKKYVVTPKGRKIISPKQRKYSPCKRSILFTEKLNIETNHNDSINSKDNEICHFESFCNDSIECFDLTHSSDDEVLCLENVNENEMTTNKSFTITQLLNELSPGKNMLNKENTNEILSSHDTQASIETMKLNISKSMDSGENVDVEYSPEFDCLNISNNKVFYETLNNSLLSDNDKSFNSVTNNEERNVIDLSSLDVIEDENCDNEMHDNIDTCSTPKNIKNFKESSIKTPLMNDEIKYSFISPNTKGSKKRNSSILRRSHSENFIDDEIFQKESTPLSKYFRLSLANRKLSRSANEIEKNNFNFSLNENNDNIFRSQSSTSTNSDISDEELNYSCNSIYKKYNSSNKFITISDDEDDCSTSATENESLTISTIENNLHLHEPFNNSAIDNNLHLHEPFNNSATENNLHLHEHLNNSATENNLYSHEPLNNSAIETNLHLYEPFNNSATENNLHLYEPLNNSAVENNLYNINKSLQHPRVLKLSTPVKVMKSPNLFNHCDNKGKGLFEKNMIQENFEINNVATPKTSIIINVENITPKGHYSDMDTPERNRELEKYGLKPMKRNKGVKILNYIYDSTHPYVNESNIGKILNNSSDEENGKAKKRRKTKSNEKLSSIDIQNENVNYFESLVKNGNEIAESEKIEDMIFERKQSKTISSCRLPLHVAWNNLLMNSKELQESILTYTPIQVEEIYEHFKNLGYKFHIQDIIAFLDKKCITIRIAQNNRQQKKVKSIK